jgi:uncharacterized membrane protein YfcA
MWMSFLSLFLIGMIIGLKLDWAAGIGMALVAIPTAYVAGNKFITQTAVKRGASE